MDGLVLRSPQAARAAEILLSGAAVACQTFVRIFQDYIAWQADAVPGLNA